MSQGENMYLKVSYEENINVKSNDSFGKCKNVDIKNADFCLYLPYKSTHIC